VSAIDLTLFIGATFVASLVAGVAGFAFGLVAAAVWMHILSPAQAAVLVVLFGLLVQGLAVWRLRHALRWSRLLPFVVGGLVGVPVGVYLLRLSEPQHVRVGVGLLLICFVVYSVARPAPRRLGGSAADAAVGVASGVVGGLTGLGGILTTVWCAFRGWPKDEQRAVFQPAAVAVFIATLAWLGATQSVPADTLRLAALGLPALAIGTWLGLRLYGRLDEAGFRKVVLALLFISGVALVFR
jgi:uncharacterized protein